MTGVSYTKTAFKYVWKVEVTSDLCKHVGYVWEDEAGQFSKELYQSAEFASYYLMKYQESLG